MEMRMQPLKFLAVSSMLLASILACDLSPYSTSVPTVSAPRDIYVATTGTDAPNCGPAARPCRTVTWGVHRAQAGSNIHIGAGRFVEAGLITITVPLTFFGSSRTTTTLTSHGAGMFEISAGVDAQVQDLTINAIAGANSNAIQVDGGNASLEMGRVNMQNNAGTAINVLRGSLINLNNCLISGSALAINNAGGMQLIDNVVFQNNIQGIYTSGVASIDRATFSANGPRVLGADIQAAVRNTKASASSSAMLTITNSSFSNNVGSAVFSDSGARTTISSSTFSANTSGVTVEGGVVSIQNSLFQNGTTPQQLALYVSGSASMPSVVDLSRSAIINMPIGVQVESDNTTVRLENVTIGVSSGGVGILAYAGDTTLSYSTIAYMGVGLSLQASSRMTVQNSLVAVNHQDCVGNLPTWVGQNFACNPRMTAADLGLDGITPAGGTQVFPLLAGSRAIDTAFGACPALDQRGYTRPSGAACDVGAYEFGAGLHETIATPGGPTETPGLLEILPSETPTVASNPQVTFIKNGNCRMGPGTGYNILTSLAQGQQASADGRDAQNLWVDILVPNTQAHCWVALSSLTLNVPVETLALLPVPPLPDAPATLTDKAQCVIKSKSLTVKLTWSDVSNETGYHVYRNGTLIETVAANVTTYMDSSAPLGKDLTYEVEAFNTNGSSARTQTIVSACK